jgi:plastocyanin
MRRPIALLLVVCAAATATMALGSALAARSTAAKSPLAGLDRTFRSLQPAARCAAASDTAARARRLRAAALKNAAKAPPKVLKRKKASMRRAIRLLRQAGRVCAAPPPAPPPPGAPPPGYGPPAPGPAPAPPGTQTVALGTVSSGVGFVPNQAVTVAAGTIHFQLANTGNLPHSIGVRTAPPPPQTSLGLAQTASPGSTTSVDITLTTPGTYQIYCGVGTHADQGGMVVPLMVTS